jgi:F-type H+-transporting ATPase subunit alpha
MQVAQQVAVLYCGTNGLLKSVPLDGVHEFERLFLAEFTVTPEYETLKKGMLDEAVSSKIEQIAATVSARLNEQAKK